MMYIEHTNLEDNLHQILTNRVPTSSSPGATEATASVEAASALLARVREAHHSASSTLQQQTLQRTTSAVENCFENNHVNSRSTTPNFYKPTTAKEWIRRRPEPNLLPLEHFDLELSKIPKPLENHSSAANYKQQQQQDKHQHQQQQQRREEEEEEQYELLHVIDSADLATQAENSKTLLKAAEKNAQQKEIDNWASTSRFASNSKDRQNIFSLDTETTTAIKEPLSQVRLDEDEDFEYIVTRVPKRKLSQQLSANQIFEVNSTSRRKFRRPVPEAIPIDTNPRHKTSYNGPQLPSVSQLVGPPLLRRIPKPYSGNSPDFNYNIHRELNGYVTAADFYGEDDNNCDYYSDSETVEAAFNSRAAYAYNNDFYRREEAQMGLDILNKLKQLFNWNPSSNHYGTSNQEVQRKRRSDDWFAGDSHGPQQIKYRKVENRFPKYIAARSEEDDVNEFLPPFTQHNKQQQQHHHQIPQYLLNNSAQNSRTLLEMSNRRAASIDKPPLRKSMFSSPRITQQLIKNATYADVEFSDDDEPILIKGFDRPPSKFTSNKRVAEVFNIPIIQTDERLRSTQHKPPPPPLIEPSTGSILQSSLIPSLEPRRKPTYAETLRQATAVGNILGGHSNTSSGASTSESSRILNGFSSLRTNHWATQNRSSILNQEKESEEREKYQQLLEQVVPRLYGSTGIENKICSASSSKSAAQRRRSALILGNAITSSAHSSPTTNRRSMGLCQSNLKRPPLSSTINLDDNDGDDDVAITGVSYIKNSRSSKAKQSLPTTVVIDDNEISDIVDLDNEERHVLSACAKIQKENISMLNLFEDNKVEKPNKDALPFVEPVNSLQERFNASPHLKDNWLEKFETKWFQKKKNRHDEVKETVKVTEKLTAERRAAEAEIQERLRKFQIVDPELLVVDDFEDAVEEPEFVELTQQHIARINAAICGPLDQVLISKFNLNITRRDIHTLCGHNWLNDEVINFYMNLLTERGEKKNASHGLPTVYAMNTFFVPRLMQAGHGGVKRWTRKVDIFTKDILPVPVHVGGVHWCMAIIHLKNRSIKYYDSMGTPNPTVLKALEQYLKDESMDKRKKPFDTSGFVIESVQGVPRQMNGSDCGVFSCMFAEYITRNREITFSQQDMEYFRQKMVLEIVTGELLQ